MSDLEFGVHFPFDDHIEWGFDRDDAIQELLWALSERELREALGHVDQAKAFMNPSIVARDPDDDEPLAWALADVTEEELDAALEFAGEVD